MYHILVYLESKMKLVELLNLNKMKYSDKIKPKHQNKMNMETEILENVEAPTRPFPENSSRETRNELNWLININEGEIDKEWVKEGDNVIKIFKDYCKDNKLKFDEKYYEQILKESSKTILKLKYHYNRPRPFQLAEYYGIKEFNNFKLPSMKTPSYPSGHSTQGYLLGTLLGKKYTKHYNKFMELAEFISKSRLMARAHYPSDCKFGKQLAMYLAGAIK